MALRSLLVFGPQRAVASQEVLAQVRICLRNEPSLKPLLDVLQTLPTFCENTIRAVQGSLASDSVFQAAQQLADWSSDTSAKWTDSSPNALLSTLSVLVDLVSYYTWIRRLPDDASEGANSSTNDISGIIGLCVGALPAHATAASLKDPSEFPKRAAAAVQCAFLVGAAVDAQSNGYDQIRPATVIVVRHDGSKKVLLDQILNETPDAYVSVRRDVNDLTLTVTDDHASAFIQRLSASGLDVKVASLRGAFHSAQNKGPLLDAIAIIQACPELNTPLPATQVPLWSDAPAGQWRDGSTYEDIMRSILLQPANWQEAFERVHVDLEPLSLKFTIAFGDRKNLPHALLPSQEREVVCIERPLDTSKYISHEGVEPEQRIPDLENDIAIVGLACRFPEATSPQEMWDVLTAGKSLCTDVGERRFKAHLSGEEQQEGQIYWGNLCTDIASFDNKFFNVSVREATYMDPQQRQILEVTYEALLSAGSLSSATRESDVGCYLGVGAVEYRDNVSSQEPSAYSAPGTLRAFIPGRISHHFGWTGPSMSLDTACSSSLVAIHTACNGIKSGDCKMAVAGGVSLMISPTPHNHLAQAGFLSTTGESRAFDAEANGYCRGEGTGAVVLKKLKDALRDGDQIHAVIAASAVNQSDNRTPITVPSSPSQSSLFTKILRQSGIEARDVGYVEAHGTGTQVGDPIEMESIRQVFGAPNRPKSLSVGSVKSNIGHLESASGVAAMIKSILVLQHLTVPKQVNFEHLNPKIQLLPDDRISVPRKNEPLNGQAVMVTNYGAAGSNAALIVCSAVTAALPSASASESLPDQNLVTSRRPFTFTADTAASLRRSLRALVAWLTQRKGQTLNLNSLAFQLHRRLDIKLAQSLALSASSVTELREALEHNVQKPQEQRLPANRALVLCFGGQVRDYVELDQHFYQCCTLFKSHVDHVDELSRAMGGPSVFPEIFGQTPVADIPKLHTMLFAVQYASARCWIESGATVTAVIGHSFGQLSAYCVAGAMTVKTALKFLQGRANILSMLPRAGRGSMLSVECQSSQMPSVMSLNTDDLDIACYNSLSQIVFAGPRDNVEALQKRIESTTDAGDNQIQVLCKRLQVTHGFHSKILDPIMPDLQQLTATLNIGSPHIAIEPCTETRGDSFLKPKNIAAHSRRPVYFSNAVQRLAQTHGSCTWLEAGTSSGITSMVRKALPRQDHAHHHFQSLRLSSCDAADKLADTIVDLWDVGHRIHFWPFHRSQRNEYMYNDLPSYQFEKTRHWLEPRRRIASSETMKNTQGPVPLPAEIVSLVSFLRPSSHLPDTTSYIVFSVDSSDELFRSYVSGHSITGVGLCPASLFMCIVAKAIAILRKDLIISIEHELDIRSLKIRSPLVLRAGQHITLSVVNHDSNPMQWDFELASGENTDLQKRTMHASGSVVVSPVYASIHATNMDPAQASVAHRCTLLLSDGAAETVIEGSLIYRMFSSIVHYTDEYRGVRKLASRGSEVAGRVIMQPAQEAEVSQLLWNPRTLDCFLQVAGIHANYVVETELGQVFVCVEIHEMRVHPGFSSSGTLAWNVLAKLVASPGSEVIYEIYAFKSDAITPMVEIKGARFRKLSVASLSNSLTSASPSSDQRQLPTPRPVLSQASVATGKSSSNTPAPPNASASADSLSVEVQSLIASLTGTEKTSITQSSSLADIGIDSLMMVETLTELQKHFGVKIPMSDFQDCDTFGSLCTYLASRLRGTSRAPQLQSLPHAGPKSATQSRDEDYEFVGPSASSGVADNSQEGSPQLIGDTSAVPSADPDTTIHTSTESSPRSERQTFDQLARLNGLHGFYDNVYPPQLSLVVTYILQAFRELNCDLLAIPSDAVIQPPHHLPRHARPIRQLFRILEEAQLAQILDDGRYIRTAKEGQQYRQPQDQLDTMTTEFPRHAAEFQLLGLGGSQLAPVLEGHADGAHVLFAGKVAKDLLEQVYADAPMFLTASQMLVQTLRDLLNSARETSAANTAPLRILEIGAGTGGTTTHVLNLLDSMKTDYVYTFTDISPSLVSKAKTKLQGKGAIEFKTLDIENEISEELQETHDIVIATNVVHATKRLVDSCQNVRRLLKPEGTLLLVELTRNLSWFDIVFGLLDGWWRFEDDRAHALASESVWHKVLSQAGYHSVEWTDDTSMESDLIRVISATNGTTMDLPRAMSAPATESTEQNSGASRVSNALPRDEPDTETIQFAQEGNVPLFADLFYPPPSHSTSTPRTMPVAIMVAGGGHVMMSRAGYRYQPRDVLLTQGFLPLTIDYRKCPEVDLESGPMYDVATALDWCRNTLPSLTLKRPDIKPDGNRVITIGWSTGGTLALSTAWTAPARGIKPPDAIYMCYGPVDYESEWWRTPHYPWGIRPEDQADDSFSIWDAVQTRPLTGYDLVGSGYPGGWMKMKDARVNMVLEMNWRSLVLPILMGKMTPQKKIAYAQASRGSVNPVLPDPQHDYDKTQLKKISPLAQARAGNIQSPVFLLQGTTDDFTPYEHCVQFRDELQRNGVEVEMALLEGGGHGLERLSPKGFNDPVLWQHMMSGHKFLNKKVGLEWKEVTGPKRQ